MFVMKGLQIKFGVQNFGELMQRMGITFGLSEKGTVFDPDYWYVTTQEAQWVGWVFNKLGSDNMDNIYFGLNNRIPIPLINPADWMSIALIFGAAVMALSHNEFKWKAPTLHPRPSREPIPMRAPPMTAPIASSPARPFPLHSFL